MLQTLNAVAVGGLQNTKELHGIPIAILDNKLIVMLVSFALEQN